jgi:transposase
MANGVNANLLRRWMLTAEGDAAQSEPERSATFVQLQVERPASPAPVADIRIELRRGATTINVAWPLVESAACAAWMRELLR